MKNSIEDQKKFGAMALVGATNSGKSTLTNSMVGEKIAIVSLLLQIYKSHENASKS